MRQEAARSNLPQRPTAGDLLHPAQPHLLKNPELGKPPPDGDQRHNTQTKGQVRSHL